MDTLKAFLGKGDERVVVIAPPPSGALKRSIEMVKAAAERGIFTEVIVLAAFANVADAVECMKLSAFAYMEKNISGVDMLELLTIKVNQALERREETVSAYGRLHRSNGEGVGESGIQAVLL
jgi:DNA-binding NtrC family response regulator